MLRHRLFEVSPFRRLVFSNLSAQAADQIGLAAAPIIAVLLFGAGPSETGLLLTLQSLPFLVLSLPAGLLVDRLSRTRLMICSELMRAASLAFTLLLLSSGLLNLLWLGILGFIASTGTVVYNVAAPSIVPSLIPRAHLSAANGNLELVRSIAYSAGPALGGLFVGLVSGSGAFAFAAFLSAVAATSLMSLDEPQRQKSAHRSIIADLNVGIRFVIGHKLLRPILLTAIFFNIAYFTIMSVFVVYAAKTLYLTPSGIGTVLASYGLGMVAGALVNPWINRLLRFGLLNSIGPMSGVVSGLLLVAMTFVPSAFFAGAAFFLFGAGPRSWTISSTTLRQTIVPRDLLGRVSSIFTMATYGSRPIGSALGGLLGGFYGPEICIYVAFVGFVLQALCTVLSPVARLSGLPEPVQ